MATDVMRFSCTGGNYAIHVNIEDRQVNMACYLCHEEALRAKSCSGKKLLRV